MEHHVHIKKLSLVNILNHHHLFLYGPANCGTSFLLRDIMYEKRKLSDGMFISRHSKEEIDYLPENCVFSIDTFANAKKGHSILHTLQKDSFLLLDKTYSLVKDEDENILEKIIHRENDFNTFIVILNENIPPPHPRPIVFDWIFIFKEMREEPLRELYEHYTDHQLFTTFGMFQTIINMFTENYGCVVLRQNVN